MPVVVFGAGETSEAFTAKLKASGISEVYCAVSNGFPKPEGVYYPEEIDAKFASYNLVPGFRAAFTSSIIRTDKYRAFRNKKSIRFLMNTDDNEIPAGFFLEHFEDYKRLYDSLVDEKSKDSYVAYLSAKLSGDSSGNGWLIELPQYFSGDFIRMGSNKV